MTKFRRGITCQITAFEVSDPPVDLNVPTAKWHAVATAQIFDPVAEVEPLTPAQVVLAGETMKIVSGKACAPTEALAMADALKALLFELTAKGFSENHDVEIW